MAAGKKLSTLTSLTADGLDQLVDTFVVVDDSATETKKITPYAAFKNVGKGLYVGSENDAETGDDSHDLRWTEGRADTTVTGPCTIGVYEGEVQNANGRNQVIAMTYNTNINGTYINAADEHSALFKLEGHWYDSSDTLMEGYLEFRYGPSSTSIRPIASTFDKGTNTIKSLTFNGNQATGARFSDDSGAAQYAELARNNARIIMVDDSDPSPGHVQLDVDSHVGYNSYFRFSANGDTITGQETVQIENTFAGGSSQHRLMNWSMRSGSVSTKKTGIVSFRADDTAGYDSIMLSLGASGTSTAALFNIDSANMPTNLPTVRVAPKASQTRGLIECDTIDNAGTTVEARGWQLYPKGYIAVRESGNATTDRLPSTGASTITPAWTNKPGASTSGTATWFPMLSTTGALFWVPGFAD